MAEEIKEKAKNCFVRFYEKYSPIFFDLVLYVFLYGVLLTLIGLFFGWIALNFLLVLKMIFGLGLVAYFIKEELPQIIVSCKSFRRRE